MRARLRYHKRNEKLTFNLSQIFSLYSNTPGFQYKTCCVPTMSIRSCQFTDPKFSFLIRKILDWKELSGRLKEAIHVKYLEWFLARYYHLRQMLTLIGTILFQIAQWLAKKLVDEPKLNEREEKKLQRQMSLGRECLVGPLVHSY